MKKLVLTVLSVILAAAMALGLTACSVDIHTDVEEIGDIHIDLDDVKALENIDWEQINAASGNSEANAQEIADIIQGLMGASSSGESAAETETADPSEQSVSGGSKLKNNKSDAQEEAQPEETQPEAPEEAEPQVQEEKPAETEAAEETTAQASDSDSF